MSDDEIELVLTTFRTFRQRLPTPSTLTDDQLRSITTRTLVLLAADTVLYDPAEAAARARLLADATVEVVPGAGHGLPFQFPERVAARLVEWVDQAPATASR